MRNGIDGKLAAAISISLLIDLFARHAPDVDDVRVSHGDHQGQNGPGYIEQPFYVGIDHRVPVVEVGLVEEIPAEGQPGIIDEDIHPPPGLRQSGDGGKDGVAILYVEYQRQYLYAGTVLQFLLQGYKPVFPSSGKNKMVAACGEFPGAGLAETRGGASDKDGPVHDPAKFKKDSNTVLPRSGSSSMPICPEWDKV